MRGKRSTGILSAVLLAAAMLAFFVGGGCMEKQYTLEKGRLSVGTTDDVIPFEGLQDGRPVGFDVELTEAIAKYLGLSYEFVPVHWTELIPGLKSRRFDVVAAAMTITFDRRKEIDFSSPYFDTDQSIVAKAGTPIKTGADLTGKTVGVLNQSTPEYAAKQIPVIGEIRRYDAVSQVYAALESGEVDAMIMDLSIARHRADKEGRTEVVAEIRTNEQYGMAVRQGNDELRVRINEALEALSKDGTYDRIYEKWFGPGK